jgi:hypothetical protein
MLALLEIHTRPLVPHVDPSEAAAAAAYSLGGGNLLGLYVHEWRSGEYMSVMPTDREYRIRRTTKDERVRATEAGFFASHALVRSFDDDTVFVLPIPLHLSTRLLLDLLAFQDSGATAFRIDQGMARLFRRLLPRRIKDSTFRRILREHLPRDRSSSQSTTSRRAAAYA